RLGRVSPPSDPTARQREAMYLDTIGQLYAAMQKQAGAPGAPARFPESLWEPRLSAPSSGKGPRRLTLALIDGRATADLPPEDKAWWKEQEERLSGETRPGLDQ